MSHGSTGKRSVVETLQEFSIPLILGVLIAVVWANVDHHSYHVLNHWSPFGKDSHFNFHFIMNDLFMALFFGIAAKEIAESCLPGGDLNPPSKAINPLLGTIGGVLGPIGVYFAWVYISGDASIANGWGIPTATDIALATDGQPRLAGQVELLAEVDDPDEGTVNRRILADIGVDLFLDLRKLLGVQRLGVAEIEAQAVIGIQRSALRHVVAKRIAQRLEIERGNGGVADHADLAPLYIGFECLGCG